MEFLENLLAKLGEFCATTGIKIIGAILVLLIGFALVKWVLGLIKKGKKFAKLAPNTQTLIIDIVMVALYVLVIAIAACTLGVSETAIASVITSCGLVVGLALQGSLSNFAGGVMIILTRPFKVDDYIEAQGYSGTVEEIRITNTKIVTPDNKVIYIPNGALSSGSIINYSEKDLRRLEFVFCIGYADDYPKTKEIIENILYSHPLTLKDKEIFVRMAEHGSSSINIKARAWVKNSDYWNVYFDITEAVKKAFDENGIEIPFNQLDVHIKQ
jgi:small conductance mechanosensitive channel